MRKAASKAEAARDDEPLLKMMEAAERCQLSIRQMWRHVGQKHLRVVRLGRAVRVRRADLDKFINGEWE